jgi:hypothetical protein
LIGGMGVNLIVNGEAYEAEPLELFRLVGGG